MFFVYILVSSAEVLGDTYNPVTSGEDAVDDVANSVNSLGKTDSELPYVLVLARQGSAALFSAAFGKFEFAYELLFSLRDHRNYDAEQTSPLASKVVGKHLNKVLADANTESTLEFVELTSRFDCGKLMTKEWAISLDDTRKFITLDATKAT